MKKASDKEKMRALIKEKFDVKAMFIIAALISDGKFKPSQISSLRAFLLTSLMHFLDDGDIAILKKEGEKKDESSTKSQRSITEISRYFTD